MKKIVLILIFAVLAAVTISAQNIGTPGEVYEESNFSIRIPGNWEIVNVGAKYSVIRGPQDSNFSPVITFTDESLSGSLSDFIDARLSNFPAAFSSFQIVRQADFTTDSGLQGRYAIIQGRFNNVNVREVLYFIPNRRGTTVMIITGTAGAVHGNRYDSVFEASAKTFSWTRNRSR